MTLPDMTLNDEKQELRRMAKEGRRAAAAAAGPEAAERLAVNFFQASPGFAEASASPVVSGYWPIADEIDVRPLLTRLHGEGRSIVLPVVVAKAAPLVFRQWQPGMTLEPGGLDTRQPGAGAPEMDPGLLLVPLLAFDGHGHRLGWGGGYYDRTLAGLRSRGPIMAVGVAYHGQRMERLPVSPGDEPLDWIVTDEEVLEFG